jgi:ATP-binding cassette subfamily B protein
VDAIGGALIFLGALIAMLVIDPVLFGLTVAGRRPRSSRR